MYYYNQNNGRWVSDEYIETEILRYGVTEQDEKEKLKKRLINDFLQDIDSNN